MTTLTRRDHIGELSNPGDYVITRRDGVAKVVLACPFCGTRMGCDHAVVQEEPLTMAPSIVGPWDKIEGPCGHHFHIENGKVV